MFTRVSLAFPPGREQLINIRKGIYLFCRDFVMFMNSKSSSAGRRKRKIRVLIPFDSSVLQQVKAGRKLLGLPTTGFVRLAVHRALEQILMIYRERVDVAAREYVEKKAKAIYQVHNKKSVPRQDMNTQAGFKRLQERLDGILAEIEYAPVAAIEAARAVNFSVRRHNPRHWGELKFSGGLLDANYARRILDIGMNARDAEKLRIERELRRVAITNVRAQMEEYWLDQVKLHVSEWANLYILRECVKAIAFGSPDKESEEEKYTRKDISDVRQALESNSNSKDLTPRLRRRFALHSRMLLKDWRDATQNERKQMLDKRLHLFKFRFEKFKEIRQRNRDQLAKVMANPEVWNHPVKLKKILQDCEMTRGIMDRKGIFAAD